MSLPNPCHPIPPPGRYRGMYGPADMDLPAPVGKGLLQLVEAMHAGTDPFGDRNPFAVTEDGLASSIDILAGIPGQAGF